MKKNIVYAKDQLISRALKLPHNLTVEANSEKGKFELQFLSLLSDNALSSLRKITDGYGNAASTVSLEFFTAVDTQCPTTLKNFGNFKWENLNCIEFHPSQPFLEHTDVPESNYVSVVLVNNN